MISPLQTIGILAGLGALYLVASPRFGERAYHRELFNPWKYPQGKYDGELAQRAEEVFFPSLTGKKLHGWYFAGLPGQKTILLCHGKTGNVTDLQVLLTLLCQTGASIFVFDYQGYGKSEGSPSVRIIGDDGFAAYKWLVETRNIAPQDIVVYGESLGGAVACEVARRAIIGGLILQSAFSTLRKISAENLPVLGWYPEFLFPHPRWNNSAIISCYSHSAVLIIHGVKDDDIKIAHGEDLFAMAREPKQIVRLPNTLHDEVAEPDAGVFVDSIKSYLGELKTASQSQALPDAGKDASAPRRTKSGAIDAAGRT